MNQRLRAAFYTAGLLASAVVLTLGLRLVFTYITPEMVPLIITAIGMSICIYVMYRLILDRIQYADKLKEMVDQK